MESLQKIDLHLHLSRIPLPRTEQMWVSDPAEMLPHMAELGIQKAVLMSTSENSQPQMPFGSNVDNRAIAQADPSHFAWMCKLDPLDLDTIPERLATYKAEGAVGIGEQEAVNAPATPQSPSIPITSLLAKNGACPILKARQDHMARSEPKFRAARIE